jgi:hypothetical protein
MDDSGNLRVPNLPNQEAYYLSIIKLVFSTLGRTYYCAYDERVAAKGPNGIGSLLVAMQRQRLVGIGGELRHLILWVDSVQGQS